MFKVGDICLITTRSNHYNIAFICGIIAGTHYEIETDKGLTRCHISSIMANSFQLIASNVTSIDEAKRLYPEYFI